MRDLSAEIQIKSDELDQHLFNTALVARELNLLIRLHEEWEAANALEQAERAMREGPFRW